MLNIVDLILMATQNNPSNRPSHYVQLLRIIEIQENHKYLENPLNEFQIIGKADVLYKQNKKDEAKLILENHLLDEPKNMLVVSKLADFH